MIVTVYEGGKAVWSGHRPYIFIKGVDSTSTIGRWTNFVLLVVTVVAAAHIIFVPSLSTKSIQYDIIGV